MANTQPSGIQIASGNLSSLTNAHTTAIELIAAPGASKLILVHFVFIYIKNGTTPWTGIGNAWLVYGTAGNDQVNMASALMTNVIQGGTASTNYIAGQAGSIGSDWLGDTTATTQRITSANSLNQPVSFTCSSAPADGNGSVGWKIWYSIIAPT